jgi:hypothetical protein
VSGLGWVAGPPLEVGGEPSRAEVIYRGLRSSVGKGGPGPTDSIEDLWRQSKAQTIASVVIMAERAALQAFPNLSTDRIPAYERLLRFGAPAGATDEQRRRAVAAAWTTENLADVPHIASSLAAIHTALRVDEVPYELGAVVELGKMFPAAGAEATGVSAFPNYADDFLLRVRHELGAGERAPMATTISDVADLLNRVMPTWVDFELVTGDGFFCDGGADGTSLLDMKTLGV